MITIAPENSRKIVRCPADLLQRRTVPGRALADVII